MLRIASTLSYMFILGFSGISYENILMFLFISILYIFCFSMSADVDNKQITPLLQAYYQYLKGRNK